MKTVQWLAVALVSAVSLPLLAQQVDANAQQGTSVNAGGAQVQDSSAANASSSMGRGNANASGAAQNSGSVSGPDGSNASTGGAMSSAAAKGIDSTSTATSASADAAGQMRPVSGELQGGLNSKTARAGDAVIVKTTQKMTTAEGTEIPKGSRLIGHVTAAQAHARGQAESQLGIVFDRAELKGGQSIGIHSIIEGIAPPASAMAAADADESADAMMAAGPMSAGGGMVGGTRAGGVLGGGPGVMNSAAGGAGNVVGHAGSGLSTAAGDTMSTTGRVSSNAAGTAAGTAHTAVGATSALAAHATAVPGVMLSGDAAGSASGMLTATGRNVELQSGTQLVLGVVAEK